MNFPLIFIALLTTLAAMLTCGHSEYHRVVYTGSCSVEEVSDGAHIRCADGSDVLVHHGQPGAAGADGTSCSVEVLESSAIILCDDGTTAEVQNGQSVTGPVGPAGTSCTVTTVTGGALIACEDGTVSTITNGVDGIDGQDAVAEIIDPCGDHPGQFDEIIIRTSAGQLVAYFEQSGKRFLAVLTPGNYRTTDAQQCNFTVTNDLTVTGDTI